MSANFERKIDFFRSNSVDFVSFGFCNIKQGAIVGIPASYFAKSKNDLKEYIPANGFQNFLGKTINNKDIYEKLDDSTLDRLENSLALSEDAKLFGIMRQLMSTNNFMISQFDKFVDIFALIAGYWYAFAKTRAFKLQLAQRRKVYLVAGLATVTVILASRLFIQKIIDSYYDEGEF